MCVLLVQRTLHHGNRVVLYGRACGKTLRICHDKSLEGRGGEGALGKQCVPLLGVVVMQSIILMIIIIIITIILLLS